MRVPISWLGEFVELPADVTFDYVHAALVKVGFEEEDVHSFDIAGPVVVGTVLEFVDEPQSNGKTIRWCQVDVGEAEPRGIVCGAHNFHAGDKVVVALPGAILPGPFPIAARKTYGHVSDGMIASARELGLGDEHDGILRLAELGVDPVVGTDAVHLLGLDDFAVEVNVTPDRGYGFSIRGIAREYSHSTGVTFSDPALAVVSVTAHGFSVTIDDAAPIRDRVGSSVFVTRVVRGIDATKPTPPWMVARLKLAGVRSISLPVDITNYVMFELGQPIHGYDLDTLAGGITVRRAAERETLVTLDGQTRSLHPEDLLITDESGPIGLAGVMGGASTEISPETTNVLIESANFDPVSIARTARRHKLPSEASKRFERGVDPAVAVPAANRVAQLLVELAGGTIDTLGSDLLEAPAPNPIALPEGFVDGLIGVHYAADEVTDSLIMIGCTISATDTGLLVTPPSWRPDLTDAPTLAEEVARIIGYDRIPSTLPVAPPGRGLTREQQLRRLASNALALSGHTEVLSYPFTDQETSDLFGSAAGGHVETIALANPLDGALPLLRTSLIPGLIDVAHRNISRGLTDLALYEIGPVFLPESSKTYGSGPLPGGTSLPTDAALAELYDGIPPQPQHIAALFLGDSVPKQPGLVATPSGIADALAAATELAETLSVAISIRQGSHHSLHPGRTAEIFIGDRSVGFAGELLPSIAAARNLPRAVAVLELDLDLLISSSASIVDSTPISSFPAATQDLSLVVAEALAAGEILAAIIEGGGDVLEHARLVDDYRGAGVPAGSKSLTFALRFRASDRTLTAAEASASRDAASALAAKRFAASVRA